MEHNLAMWKQLLHVENDFSIWKKNVSTPRSETNIKIAGDIFGLEEFDQN